MATQRNENYRDSNPFEIGTAARNAYDRGLDWAVELAETARKEAIQQARNLRARHTPQLPDEGLGQIRRQVLIAHPEYTREQADAAARKVVHDYLTEQVESGLIVEQAAAEMEADAEEQRRARMSPADHIREMEQLNQALIQQRVDATSSAPEYEARLAVSDHRASGMVDLDEVLAANLEPAG